MSATPKSDSPRTDAASRGADFYTSDQPAFAVVVPVEFARSLERELSEVTRERDELRELMVKGGLSLITPDEPPLEARQDWAKLRGAIAFQIIERHADDWDEIDTMMEEWRVARTQAVAARTLPTTELPKNET